MHDNTVSPAKALLITIQMAEDSSEEVETLLEELGSLVSTLGVEVVKSQVVFLRKPNPTFFIGSGKAEEIAELAKELKCTMIVFDNELHPGQQRNWEELTGLSVIDRQEVILDIFAKRAHTREAVLQVELARAKYMLPRLTRAWTHLSRQRGGGAMQRGEGEQQIEVDRRIVRNNIARLKKELAEVSQHRDIQRKRREKIPLPSAAIVGYTNAGKSSLLNKLTGAQVLAEDKLFATLDPTTRRLKTSGGQILLLTDTVGFVRRLPHDLIEAFKATLEEVVFSDFLIHVADLSSPDMVHHMETTMSVMKELGADDRPVILAFNKVDVLEDDIELISVKAQYPDACFISTKTGDGLDLLLEKIEIELEKTTVLMELVFPHDKYGIVSELHEIGAIRKEEAREDGVYITGSIPKRYVNRVEPFRRI